MLSETCQINDEIPKRSKRSPPITIKHIITHANKFQATEAKGSIYNRVLQSSRMVQKKDFQLSTSPFAKACQASQQNLFVKPAATSRNKVQKSGSSGCLSTFRTTKLKKISTSNNSHKVINKTAQSSKNGDLQMHGNTIYKDRAQSKCKVRVSKFNEIDTSCPKQPNEQNRCILQKRDAFLEKENEEFQLINYSQEEGGNSCDITLVMKNVEMTNKKLLPEQSVCKFFSPEDGDKIERLGFSGSDRHLLQQPLQCSSILGHQKTPF